MRRTLIISSLILLFLIASFGSCGEGESAPPIVARSEGPPSGVDETGWGEQLFASHGCVGCHTTNHSRSVGGTMAHIWGRPRTFVGGSLGIDGGAEPVIVDEEYVRRSLLDPGAQVVEGFEPVMPSYEGLLDDAEIAALTEFIRSMR